MTLSGANRCILTTNSDRPGYAVKRLLPPPSPGLSPPVQAVPRVPPHLGPPRLPPGPPHPLPRPPRALPHPAALPQALLLLRSLPFPATNDLNAALRGLAASRHPARSLLLLAGRLLPPPSPPLPRLDALSLSFALRASARCSDAPTTVQIHALVIRLGVTADVRLHTTLVDSYAKCGNLESARKVFDEMTIRDVATWNALMAGLAQGTEPNLALALFHRLADSFQELPSREEPNEVTIVAALSACAQLGSLQDGLRIPCMGMEAMH
ncbi:hypothetical protein E2562_014361 [Oryza meyeriana var. granulata]|uniref:Pentatricopeptide repeat-containing protein n=1 Tax=Oryza meyeriana var. granulata TaxID=110450 RepID=A0A6G1C6G6_9ORYZ|nr:hypothetical protein E2562_014361 [Oryza meyeriana var. granulata]